MGLLARAVAERKSGSLDVLAEILRAGTKSKAGATVNLEAALKVTAFFACLRKLSNGCAQVPFKLFQSVEVDGLERIMPARDHYLYDKLAVQPNAWSTSFEFRETLVLHAALGNAYVFKNRGTATGKIHELILLNPARVEKVQRKDFSIIYKVTGESGAVQEFPAETIWHVRGPSWDGVLGLDTLKLVREALGLAIATEETHARLHEKGIRTAGTYSVEGPLNKEQYQQLKEWLIKEAAGAENAGAPMILDRGAKWLSQQMTGLDAQHLETRRFQIEEVCRGMDVMPIMVGYSDKAQTYASAEQMFLAHVIHTLMPWYARIEQSADVNLLTAKEREQGLYFKFIATGLLRGSAKDRSEYFAKALGAGGSPPWMTQDEVRGLEELNPFGGSASELPPITSAPKAPTNPEGD
jgi:HK97 family phage portal protein